MIKDGPHSPDRYTFLPELREVEVCMQYHECLWRITTLIERTDSAIIRRSMGDGKLYSICACTIPPGVVAQVTEHIPHGGEGAKSSSVRPSLYHCSQDEEARTQVIPSSALDSEQGPSLVRTLLIHRTPHQNRSN